MIDDAMMRFYEVVISFFEERELPSQAQLLAYVDHVVDQAIHPWADGCGRGSTALVMWISLLYGNFPCFVDKATHYKNIKDIEAHTVYFQECLERSL